LAARSTRSSDPLPERVEISRHANAVFRCDCADLLGRVGDEAIDLIYIDPPFCTQARRNGASGANYGDSWRDGLDGYLEFLEARLRPMHRVLSRRGSLFVHLDYRTVHYVKVMLDRIFGPENFMNEIIWSYRTGGVAKQWFGRKHQTVLAYAKRLGEHTFHQLREGEYRTDGMNYDEEGRPYKMTKKGRLYFDRRGPAVTDVWEIPFLSTVGREREGYPDQKPLKLLERIVGCCSNEGDVVADFFCGSGTALVAAKRLKRRWVGCDVNPDAVVLARKRLAREG